MFVTRDDHGKILGFGIARVVEDELSGDIHTRITVQGTILGTVGYMSPEQVRGERVDHRSDIFAFGAVPYEMLAGQRAFGRNTGVDTLSAILHEEPPAWPRDGSPLSIVLRRLTRQCLEKAATMRFQSARDLAIVLRDVDADGPASVGPAARRPRMLIGRCAVLARASRRRPGGHDLVPPLAAGAHGAGAAGNHEALAAARRGVVRARPHAASLARWPPPRGASGSGREHGFTSSTSARACGVRCRARRAAPGSSSSRRTVRRWPSSVRTPYARRSGRRRDDQNLRLRGGDARR